MIPKSLRQNEGLHTQRSQFKIFSAVQKDQRGGSELRAPQASHQSYAASTTFFVAPNGLISRESTQSYQGVVTQTDEARHPFLPYGSTWISRGDATDRQARLNGVSSNSSQTLDFPQMTDPMIDGSQINFSLPTVDRASPQRTNIRVAALQKRRELLQYFRDPTAIPVRTRLEAVEIDENAEINQMSGANNVGPLPSTQVAEAAASAANEASGTNIIRTLEGRRVAGEMTLSKRRDQHRYNVRLERIKELLVSGNVNDSDVCLICEETYTAPLEAPTNITEGHACPNCRGDYTTTPHPGNINDACAMPDCLHVFCRCCIMKCLTNHQTCSTCRNMVNLP